MPNGSDTDHWRRMFRRGLRAAIGGLPEGVREFVYRQIKGVVRDVGRWGPEERVILPDGGKMLLDLGDSQQRHLYYCGFYERRSIACLARFLRPGDTFVDIGANVGYFTIWAARRLQPAGRVFSFEPNPQAYARLAANVSANEFTNVVLFNTAVGERESTACLTANRHDTATSYLVSGDGLEVAGCVRVPVRSLDSCLAEVGAPRVSLVKMDAEGSEPAILRGAERTLACRPRLLVEVDEMRLERAGSSARELLATLAALGYAPYEVGRRGSLTPLRPGKRRGRYVNLCFLPREEVR